MLLDADLAELHGSKMQVEARAGQRNIGFWDDPREWVSWTVKLLPPGTYAVSALLAAQAGETEFVVEAARQKIVGKAPNTGSWDEFQTINVGEIRFKKPGEYMVKLRPRDPQAWKPMDLALIRLQKAD